MHKLILASASPRRKKLLEDAGFRLQTFPVNVSEYLEKNLTLDAQILRIAETKARAAFNLYNPLKSENFLILSADTMVILDNQPLGKPKDENDAELTLGLLSGRKHYVKTAVYFIEGCVFDCQKKIIKVHSDIETTEVHFRPIMKQEIKKYVASGDPLDKAGSYGIQGQAGNFVEKIVGNFNNVVGLPTDLVTRIIEQNSWKIERDKNV